VRVAFLIDRLFPGGTELQLLGLLRALDRTRVCPYLCLLDGEDPLSRSIEPDDLPVIRLGIRSLRRPSTFRQARRFFEFLRRERIEIVQTYFEDSSFFGVPVARLAGVRKLVRTRFRLTDRGLPAATFWAARLINRLVTTTVANSRACGLSVIADEWVRPATVRVIPNGIDLDRFEGVPGLEPRTAPDGLVHVGMVANLWPIKEPWLLVEAARLLAAREPRVRFAVAGRGELLPDLQDRVAGAGLGDRFTFLGGVADVPAFLGGVRVAVLTSRSEGLPNAVLEYMAAGRAVVATAVGGTVDLIEHGRHGLLVPPGDAPALAEAVGRLVGDPALAARLGRAARDRVRRGFGREHQARCYQALYERLLTGKRR
jgi:glycosyltransferase involved in cell wall biosynthesis